MQTPLERAYQKLMEADVQRMRIAARALAQEAVNRAYECLAEAAADDFPVDDSAMDKVLQNSVDLDISRLGGSEND